MTMYSSLNAKLGIMQVRNVWEPLQ